MDEQALIRRLRSFVAVTTLQKNEYDFGTFDELPVDQATIAASAQIAEQIMDRVTPKWRVELAPDPAEQWQPTRLAAVRAISQLENAVELERILGSDAPTMSADALHPWAWEGAQSLWQSGHYGEAVLGALQKLNAELQNKLARNDISEGALFQQAFSSDPPSGSNPRLRLLGDDGSRTASSLRRGVMSLGEGLFAAVRNPSAHLPIAEISQQIALEQLALISLLSRWVADSSRVTA